MAFLIDENKSERLSLCPAENYRLAYIMKALTRIGWLFSALLLLLADGNTRAEIKNFVFHGTVTVTEDTAFLLDGSVTNGTPIEGFYIFESEATNSNSDPTVGDYRYTNSTFGIVLKIGSYVFRTNPRHVDFLIEVVDRPGNDSYLLRSYNNVCSEPLFVQHISWQLDDPTGSALQDALLPAVPPTLSAYQSWFGLMVTGGDIGGMPYSIHGAVDSITEAPAVIPERPATTLSDAVQVSWPSRLGYFYQIQSSEDLATWTNIGEPVLGDGTTLSRFFPRNGTNQVFYRAEIANFSN